MTEPAQLPPQPPGASPPRPPPRSAALLGVALPNAAAAQKAALTEVSTAFGQLLQDLQFSFVISCARSDDCPIVYASSNFFTCTQYTPAEVLGRNCRFLQGECVAEKAGRSRWQFTCLDALGCIQH